MKICFYSSASSASLFNIIFINDADIQYSSVLLSSYLFDEQLVSHTSGCCTEYVKRCFR